RQLDRDRPAVPGRLPARDRDLAALPLGGRVLGEGTGAALVSEHPGRAPEEAGGPPRPRRHPGECGRAAVLPRAGVRTCGDGGAAGGLTPRRPAPTVRTMRRPST